MDDRHSNPTASRLDSRPEVEGPLRVICPTCEADRGEGCVQIVDVPRKRKLPLSQPHATRALRAEELDRPLVRPFIGGVFDQ